MSVETRLRKAAEDTREKISGLTPPPVRQQHRRAVWGWAVVGFAVVLAAVFLTPRLTTNQRVVAEPAPDETIHSEDFPTLVVRGAESPEPEFDTTELGEEVVLGGVDDPELTRLVAGIETADPEAVGGELAEITVVGTLGDGSTIALLSGEGAEPDACIWQTSPTNGYSCFGLPDLQTPITSTFAGTTSWGPLPADTSVAQLIQGDESYWQRPIGRVAAFDIELPAERGGYMLKAFDASENIVHMEGQLPSASIYADELGREWYATDCPNADVLLTGTPDGLPMRGQTDLDRVLLSVGDNDRTSVIPRNGEVWGPEEDGTVASVSRVRDFMIQATIDSADECPSAPHFNNGIPVAYKIAN